MTLCMSPGAATRALALPFRRPGLGRYGIAPVRDMLMGGEYRFADRGEHELKGLEGPWRLYALER